MDPGVLVPDVGHLEQVPVQPAGLERLHKHGGMGLGTAGRDNHPVELFLNYLVLDLVLRVLAAGKQVVVRKNNTRQGRGILLETGDIDDSGYLLAQPYLPNPGYDVKLYNTGDEVFATIKRSPLHPGAPVVEEPVPVTRELRALALAVGRTFGLDICGLDVIETPQGWMVLDVNDFPSFGNVPHAAERLARTVLRLARQAVARRVTAETRTLHTLPSLEWSA